MLSQPQALHSTLPAMETLHHSTTPPIPRLKLGTQGLEVSKLGFGCAGLSGYLNLPVPASDGISIINAAFHRGITFFDTSDSYGPHTNEILLGQALKQLPRDKIQIATKFGVAKFDKNSIEVNGSPEYVRASCEASLRRLGVDYIDLYYQHRVDMTVPIEDTMGELKKLVEEGKVRYVGLSEPSVDTLRRGHAVHPVSAVQMEWSIWTREIEEEIVPLCRKLGIGIVACSPIGRGFFAGKGTTEDLPENSILTIHPRFIGDNLEKNKVLYDRVQKLASKHCCSSAQLALSWVLHQGNDVVPIPECETFDSIEHKEILIGDTKKYGLSLHHLEPLALSTLHKLISMVHNSVQISGQDLAVEPTVQISGQDLAVEPTGTNDLAAERTCTKDVVVDPRNEHKYTALNNSSLLEKDPVASILSSVESPVLQKVLLAMVHNFPRTLEALILHMLSPAAAEVLTRKFDEIDQQTPKEQQNEFYEQFYSIFDDQYAAMEAILNGKESFAFQAFQRVLDQYVGVTIDKPQ